MPAQPVLRAGALGHEVLAVIGQQADLHRGLVEVGGGEALRPVPDHGAGDRERVDLVRLARLALAPPGGAHPVRCHPHDPLPGPGQRRFEPARNVPAVLDRPHPLIIQPARPAHRSQIPRLLGPDLASAALPARPRIDGRQRVRALVRVRPDHDHAHRPFDLVQRRRSGSPADNHHSGRCHAPITSRRRSSGGGGRHKLRRSDQADDTAVSSQPAASPRTNRSGRTSPPKPQATLTVTGVSGARAETLAFCGCMAELERRGLRTEARLSIPHGPCAAFRAPGRAAARRYRAHPPRSRRPPRRPARPRPRVGLRRPARRAVSGAFPRVRSASGPECSPQPGRPTGSPSAEERLDQLVLAEMVGHDNHWKISVVQSPPWRRTSWARAGPSGRAWKSTKKSRSTSIPPSGWQFTFRSQERSSG
jgi:hypothetical protein